MSSIAVVTDSTGSLPADVTAARGITVVSLQVIIDDVAYTEGQDVTPADIADALGSHRRVSTSRPAPEVFARAYAAAAADGATEIVSVHLSAEVSGTFESAQMAAADARRPVHCVDSRQVGFGTGYAALTAADLRDRGATVEECAVGARERGARTTALFYVDTLEYLRRGGRVGTAAALVGSALAVKPLLSVRDGRIGPLEKVRTTSRALARLEQLAVERAEASPDGADLAVQHLANADSARAVADRLGERLGVDDMPVGEVGAVIGAHVGPGMVAVTVADRPGAPVGDGSGR